MIHEAISSIYRTSTGNKFRGVFSDPEDRFEGDEMRAPRILRVGDKAPVSSGVVVKAHGTEYLLFLHSQGPGQKRFLAYQVTHRVSWKRQAETTDPVTKMKTNGAPQELDPDFPIYLEPTGTTDEHDLERTKYLIRCPAGVEVGDLLGDYTVHSLQKVPGASIIGAY